MASVEPRPHRSDPAQMSWRTRWRYGGKRGGKWQYCTWDDENLALQAKLIAERHQHAITDTAVIALIVGDHLDDDARPPTVRVWAAIWLDARTRIGPGQRHTYRRQLDRVILPAIGHLRLDEVQGTDIVAILRSLTGRDGKPATPATRTRYFACMTSLFGYAVKEKKITDNPCKRTDFVRDMIDDDDTGEDEDDGHVYLTRAEYGLIRANMKPAGIPVIDILIGTGARWSEATAVPVRAVGPAGRTVRIARAWKWDGHAWYLGATKSRRRRTVTASGVAAQAMARLASGRAGEELLLTAPRGGRLTHSNFFGRYFEPAIEAAMRCPRHPPEYAPDRRSATTRVGTWRKGAVSTCDCPGRLHRRPTLHDLRHTHVAWLIAAGVLIVVISRRLGHRTTEITETVYAGILREVAEGAADALARYLGEEATTGVGAGQAGDGDRGSSRPPSRTLRRRLGGERHAPARRLTRRAP